MNPCLHGESQLEKEQKRSWLAIAEELSHEQDSAKVAELAEELNKP